MLAQRLFRAAVLCSLFLITATSARAADQPPDLNSLSDTDLRTLTIRMERTGCFGNCPAYTVTIHGDGGVEYEGKSHVKESGAQQARLEPDTIKALTKEFSKANFLTLSEDYSEEKCARYCTDMPTAVTEINLKAVNHRVKHYYGCVGAPKALFDLESAIDKLANTERWTGDVSKAGPFGTTCMDRK
jgi:hypothetical protein